MHRLPAIFGPLILLVIVSGSFWKLLTKQYTWMDHPDMAYQVLPWYQFEAASWHRGEFPLWDPHVFGGQPLVGQLQPGAAYPPNWLLFLMPLRDGHIQQVWLHAWFILAHFFAALFCYWLCRELGHSFAASVFAGFVFALSGVVGSIGWPQMLNGAIWIPLIVLFYLRWVRGQRALASAAFAGIFLGISFLSGHHQIPAFTALTMAGLWIVEIFRRRLQAAKAVAVFTLFAGLGSALQVLPGIEYGIRSIRWVGSQNPVSWGQYVPYIVHQQYSLTPLELLNFAISGGPHDTFMGITVLTLALLGFAWEFERRIVRMLAGICIGGLLFSFGAFSVFHGVAYLVIPMVEKARTPAMAIVIVQFALAVMCGFGMDALRRRSPGRLCFAALLTVGLTPWPVLAAFAAVREEASREYERFAVAAIAALAVAGILYGWKWKRLSEKTAVALLSLTALFEIGTVVGQSFRHRETPGGFLQALEQHKEIAGFLRKQSDFVRLEVDTDALPYNIGDWEGIDQFQGYLGGVTANIVPFGIEMLNGGRLADKLFALNYAVGRKPLHEDQIEVFHGTSGLNIYRNPEAFPRIWTVHRLSFTTAHELIPRLEAADLRREAFLTGPGPKLDECGGADGVRIRRQSASYIAVEARMACKGMVILSQTFFPGWKAEVDGRPAPVYEAYGVLQGVMVDRGIHRIELRYRPGSVYWGGALTAAGLLASLALALARQDAAASSLAVKYAQSG